MEEPPCAKSRERVLFFSPLPIAFNTRVGVILPPGPGLGGSERRYFPPSFSSPRALGFEGEISAENTVPTRAFLRLTSQKRAERENEVNEEN